jgi:hypothetical protein
MNRFAKTFVMCAAMVGLAGACKKSTDDTYKAADRVEKEQRELSKSVDKKVDNAVESVKDLAHQAQDVGTAEADFNAKRDARVRSLHAFQAIDVANLTAIKSLASALPLTDKGRTQVGDKVAAAELRLDESSRMIEQLPTATADSWKVRDQAVSDAMVRLRDAIDAGFSTLRDAPRLPASAS